MAHESESGEYEQPELVTYSSSSKRFCNASDSTIKYYGDDANYCSR
jgi:hypothetical protein